MLKLNQRFSISLSSLNILRFYRSSKMNKSVRRPRSNIIYFILNDNGRGRGWRRGGGAKIKREIKVIESRGGGFKLKEDG